VNKSVWQRDGFWAAVAAGGTLLVQLYLCHFFDAGKILPLTSDINPANYWVHEFHFPPTGTFYNDYWFGIAGAPIHPTPYNLLAHLPEWLFFTAFYPLFGALAVFAFFWLLRELRFPAPVAVVGGIIYGWQGPLLSNIYAGHFSIAVLLAVFPLAIWQSLRAIHYERWYAAVLAGLFTGIMVAEQPDIGGLSAVVVGLLFLSRVTLNLRQTRTAMRILAQLAVTITIACLVAWPGLESTFRSSVTGVSQGTSESPEEKWAWATQWSFPPEEILTYLAPGYFGWRTGSADGPYWGRTGQTEGWPENRQGFRNFTLQSTSLGTIAILLAALGIWAIAQRTNFSEPTTLCTTPAELTVADQRFYGRLFGTVALVTFLLALGKYAPFFQFIYHLPYMNTWRNPVKFLIGPTNFCLCVLTAYGAYMLEQAFTVTTLRSKETPPVKTWIFRTVLLLAGAILLWLIAIYIDSAGAGRMLQAQAYQPVEIQAILRTKSGAVLAVFLVLLAVGLGLYGLGKMRSPTAQLKTLAWGLAVLVLGQMCWVHSHFLEPYNSRQAYQLNPMLAALRTSHAPVRVKVFAQDPLLHYYLSSVFTYHNIASIDNPAASRIGTDYLAFFRALQDNPARLWQLGGVKYVALPSGLAPQLAAVPWIHENVAAITWYQVVGRALDNLTVTVTGEPRLATHAVMELKDYLAKATFVPHLEVLDDEAALAQRLNSRDWNPRHTILVTRSDAQRYGLQDPPPQQPVSPPHLRLVRYDKAGLQIEVESPTSGFLLINDRYQAEWRCTVNGADTVIFPANLLLRGVAVPAGQSQLVMRLNYPATPIYVSLITYLGVGVLGAVVWWRNRKGITARTAP
jgi:hypothetical protein